MKKSFHAVVDSPVQAFVTFVAGGWFGPEIATKIGSTAAAVLALFGA